MIRTGSASSATTTTTGASTSGIPGRSTWARSCRPGVRRDCCPSPSIRTSICWSTGSGSGSSTRACRETPTAEEPDRYHRGLRHPGGVYGAGDRLREPARRHQGAQGGRMMGPALVELINLTRDPGAGDFLFVLIWAVCTILL